MLKAIGVRDIIAVDEYGILSIGRKAGLEGQKEELANITNPRNIKGGLKDALINADIFIGTSVAGCLNAEMIKVMNANPIIFALANPIPEIFPEEAKRAGAKIICTGRSDYVNQVNNVLVFPGLFRGTLDVQANQITEHMKIAAAYAIAGILDENELTVDCVLPSIFDTRVKKAVSEAVKKAAIEDGVSRI